MKTTNATKSALTGLEWAIAQTVDKPKQPGEFTCQEYVDATGKTEQAASSTLKRMVQSGMLVARKVTIKGTRANLYRKP